MPETQVEAVELLDTEIEGLGDMVEDATHFKTAEPVEIQFGESAGNPVFVRSQFFIAASVDGEIEDEVQRQMTGEDHIDESSVFTSNEDGEIGDGFLRVEEGDIGDALDEFLDEHL